MRIISGKFKGKLIDFIKSNTTRPLKDSVKENIFNVLDHSNLLKVSISNSKVLDLYSGIGSFGLECLSRNAKKVCFVEQDESALKTLKVNLSNLSIIKKTSVFEGPIVKFLEKSTKDKFEIFFLDPPFKENNYLDYLNLIAKKNIFNKNHIVIIHRNTKTLDNLDSVIKTIIVKKYGRSKIIFGKFLR